MKKLSLITEFKESYKGSDLQKIVNNNPLPIKYTIDGFDCYFYNADLFGLFEWKIQKDGITTSDFINDYRNGFKSGLLHLKELEKIKLKDLKSKDLREGTISQLKYILHEREFKLGSKGLLDLVFNKVPLIFTEKNIFDYGYWNGIIYSIDDIIKKAGLTLDELKTSEPQQNEKQKPELNRKLITFKNSETIDKIHSELKGYFLNKEAELLEALQGEKLSEILLFPHNQNKFVEVFRRLKYNGFLLNTDTETKNWICTTFQFVKKGFTEPQPFNESSVWDNLNKGKGEPTKKERICITDWLPYKSPLQLTRETENEKL